MIHQPQSLSVIEAGNLLNQQIEVDQLFVANSHGRHLARLYHSPQRSHAERGAAVQRLDLGVSLGDRSHSWKCANYVVIVCGHYKILLIFPTTSSVFIISDRFLKSPVKIGFFFSKSVRTLQVCWFPFMYKYFHMLISKLPDCVFFLFLGGCFCVVQSSVWLSLSRIFITSAARYAEPIPR